MGSCSSLCPKDAKQNSIQSVTFFVEDQEKVQGNTKALNYSNSSKENDRHYEVKEKDAKKMSRFSKTTVAGNDSSDDSRNMMIQPLDINIEEKLREKEEKKKKPKYEDSTKDGNKIVEIEENEKCEPLLKISQKGDVQVGEVLKSQKSVDPKSPKKNPNPNSVSSIGTKDQTPASNKESEREQSSVANAEESKHRESIKKNGPVLKKSAQSDSSLVINKADAFIHLKKGNLSDFYSMGKVLGEGAYGKVNIVTHKSTGMSRAMKSIKKKTLPKEDEKKLFSEMSILSKLDHPNIIKLFELYQDDEHYYLITEYCSGGELFDRIKKMNQFSEKIGAEYMKQILAAIVYCHTNNIVHRDMKPENIVFESKKENSNLKIIDFGTSRNYDPSKGVVMTKKLGTPYYIAPEVLGKGYTEKCDVWSCGIILYILLCGYPPFLGRTPNDIFKKIKEGKLDFPYEDWSRISDDAKRLIRKMLTQDPSKRLSSQEAYNDPWIQKNTNSIPLNTKCLSNLSNFQANSRINGAIMTFIASQILTHQDKEEIRKNFQALDKNGDGNLSREELVEGYIKVYGDRKKAEAEVDRILTALGKSTDSTVDYTQFITAAINTDKILSRKKVEQAFSIFDQDGDGSITKKELEMILGGVPISEEAWLELIEGVDSDKNGQISNAEFIDILMKKIM